MKGPTAGAAALLLCLATAGSALGATWDVKMLNHGSDGRMMVFEPAFVKVAPGDTVRFLPVDKGHNVALIPGMAPAGAPSFKGDLSQEVDVRFEKKGVYGYECVPHAGLGMVGVIEVGAPTNKAQALAAADQLVGDGKRRMLELLALAR